MKKICFILALPLLLFVHTLQAQTLLDKSFSLKLEKTKLKNVLTEVQKQTKVTISFSANFINTERVISYAATNKKIADFLADLEKNYQIGYQLVGDRVILFSLKATPKAVEIPSGSVQTIQENWVSGVLSNEKGELLAGATVIEKGKTNAAATDDKGFFKLKLINPKALLVISSTGYQPKEISASAINNTTIILASTVKSLDEVVVIGYGTVNKSDLTGSVSKLKMENVAQQTSSSFEQLIQGKTAGVNITQTSGDPGSGIIFNIRGTNSLGANQPLIVIDGVPIESDNNTLSSKTGADYFTSQIQPTNALANINPNDIESIEILKDASSTAIFGSRGANGVVMITTRKGKAGRDKVYYNYRYDASQLPKQIAVLNSRDFATYANEATYNSDSSKGMYSRYSPGRIDSLSSINWQDVVYHQSKSQDHQVSLVGGDDRTKYALSGNYTTINGIVNGTFYNKKGISFNIDRQFSKNLKLGILAKTYFSENIQGLQSTNHANQGGSVVTTALRSSPLGNPFTEDGELNTKLQYNPSVLLANSVTKSKGILILTNVFGEYALIPNDLKLKVSASFNQNNNQSTNYWGRGTVTGDAAGGQAYQVNNQNLNYLTEYTLNYNKSFTKGNRINAVMGYTSQSWTSNSFGVNAKGFPNDNLGADGLAYATNIVNLPASKAQKWYLQSFLGRVNFTFHDKYLLTITGRQDGSSKLAIGNQWSFFPSVALGWNLYKEGFLRNVSFLSNAKLRSSYGISGNQNIPIGSTNTLLAPSRAGTGQDSIISGVVINYLGNKNLKWEKTEQTDIGLDLGFMKDKYQLSIDFYKKTTSDLLFNLPIPSDNGFSYYPTNLGKVENTGLEIEGNARFALTKKLVWKVAANISFNQNKVINLGQNDQVYGSSLLPTGLDQYGTIATAGHAIGSFYGYKLAGIYQNNVEVSKGPIDPLRPTPGDYKYMDLNGNDSIDANDRTFLGNPNPKYFFGLTNTFTYKGFELSIFIMGKVGQSVLNLNRFYSDGLIYSVSGNLRQEAWDGRWRGEGTSNYYPKAKTTGSLFDKRINDHLVEDASFIRLKNVNLSYAFNIKKVKFINSLKVFVNATNLFIITKYKGFDPEVSGFGLNALTQGVDFGTIPQYRTFSTGINVGL